MRPATASGASLPASTRACIQFADYTEAQLEAFRAGRRANDQMNDAYHRHRMTDRKSRRSPTTRLVCAESRRASAQPVRGGSGHLFRLSPCSPDAHPPSFMRPHGTSRAFLWAAQLNALHDQPAHRTGHSLHHRHGRQAEPEPYNNYLGQFGPFWFRSSRNWACTRSTTLSGS